MCVLAGIATAVAACDEPQTTAPNDLEPNDIGSVKDPGVDASVSTDIIMTPKTPKDHTG